MMRRFMDARRGRSKTIGFACYGKGHVFYSSLGHMPETFMTPELVGHFLAGMQFMLGDLDADATPNPHGG